MAGNSHNLNPPRGAGVDLASARLARADLTLHRHTPPGRSGFGTDRPEGIRFTAAPWTPPAPKGAGGSKTFLLQVRVRTVLPAGCAHYTPFGDLSSYLLRSSCTGCRARRSRPIGSDVGSARRISGNICILMYDSMGSC